MPTYAYECKTCGYSFDRFQSMQEEPLEACPECGKKVRRVINGGLGTIFKGSGFYVNDSRKSSSAEKTPDTGKVQDSPKPTPCAGCDKHGSGAQ